MGTRGTMTHCAHLLDTSRTSRLGATANWSQRAIELHCTLTDSEETTGQEGKTMASDREAPDPLLTPAEVAVLFRVNPKTVSRWARSGKLTSIRTLGGHRRFRASEVRSLVEQSEEVVETF